MYLFTKILNMETQSYISIYENVNIFGPFY